MFRKMPFILLAMIILAAITHPWLPLSVMSVLYAMSLSLKAVIVFALPFLVFGLLFKTAVQLAKKASKMILFLFAAICISNFISTLLSYGVGQLVYRLDISMVLPQETASLLPAWQFFLPKWIGNDVAMFSGLSLGILLGWLRPAFSEKVAGYLERAIALFLKGFLGIIPIFILGFVIKMIHDKVMLHILRNYALIFTLIACAVFSYIALLYLIANRWQRKAFVSSLKNMLPSAMAGFGSMSSAASMPLTIIGAEKNAQNPDVARSVISATVNIHLLGDCFAIPIFAFAVLKNFGIAEPSFAVYLTFVAYFVLAKFSVAAVPGGGILVMLPILENVFGFDAGMLSLITALYILFDPVITCANIFGNGGFAMIIDRLQKSRSKKLESL